MKDRCLPCQKYSSPRSLPYNGEPTNINNFAKPRHLQMNPFLNPRTPSRICFLAVEPGNTIVFWVEYYRKSPHIGTVASMVNTMHTHCHFYKKRLHCCTSHTVLRKSPYIKFFASPFGSIYPRPTSPGKTF